MAEFMRLSPQPRSMTTVGALFVIASFKLMSPLWAADAETTFAPAVTVIQSKRSCFADALEVTGVVVPAHEILVATFRTS